MLTICQRRLSFEVPTALIKSMLEGLKGQFNWFITSLKQEYLAKLNLGPQAIPFLGEVSSFQLVTKKDIPLAGGDFVFDKKGNYYYIKVPADRSYLECGCIIKGNDLSDFLALCATTKEISKNSLPSSELEWKEANVLDQTIKEYLASSCEELKPTKDELEAAKELEQPATRSLLSRILASPEGSFLNTFTDILSKEELITTIERLEHLKLVNKSFVVLCRERNREIIKVNTRDAILDASRKGLKCSMCGRPISEEHIDELLSGTSSGLRLISQHYWMPIRVVDQLQSLGVQNDKIHVEFQDNGFVLIYLECGNQLILLALLDRPLTLQDAQFLTATVGVHKVKKVALVSTDRIPTLLKTYLKQFNPGTSLFFIDSYVRLEKRLPKLLEEIWEEQISNITEDFTWLTPINIQELAIRRLFLQEQETNHDGVKESLAASLEPEPQKREKGRRSQKEKQEEEEILT